MPMPELLRAILATQSGVGQDGQQSRAGAALRRHHPAADHTELGADAAPAGSDRVIMMQALLGFGHAGLKKNPWRYAALPGFEVLSRASDEATQFGCSMRFTGTIDRERGAAKGVAPQSPVPYLVIIGDTNLATVGTGRLHAQPLEFRSPVDALTWAPLRQTKVWAGAVSKRTTTMPSPPIRTSITSTQPPGEQHISLERLSRCTPRCRNGCGPVCWEGLRYFPAELHAGHV